jgi:hypothetical protein
MGHVHALAIPRREMIGMKQTRHLFAIALMVSFAARSKDTTAPGDTTSPPS